MRRILTTFAVVLLLACGLAGVAIATGGGSAITRPRLEDAVTAAFDNVYSREAALLGHQGVTPASMGTKTYCDKGPGIPQSGPGTTWNCLASWKDPSVPMPSTGYGKLEVTVHTNGCFTVGAPSSLVGYQTITDASGRTVPNPAYEFDGCLDPNGENTPNGVVFPPELKITNTTVTPDASGHVGADLLCAPGHGGCSGVVTAVAGGTSLGSVPFSITETATAQLMLPRVLPAGATDVTYTVRGKDEVLPSPTDVTVQR
ncbi:hypothetical protein GCM10028801_15300 [Nocardioides maradonensis]